MSALGGKRTLVEVADFNCVIPSAAILGALLGGECVASLKDEIGTAARNYDEQHDRNDRDQQDAKLTAEPGRFAIRLVWFSFVRQSLMTLSSECPQRVESGNWRILVDHLLAGRVAGVRKAFQLPLQGRLQLGRTQDDHPCGCGIFHVEVDCGFAIRRAIGGLDLLFVDLDVVAPRGQLSDIAVQSEGALEGDSGLSCAHISLRP